MNFENGRGRIYLATFLYSLQYALVLYINSSYLGKFFTTSAVSFLFVVGALGAIIVFAGIPSLLHYFGVKRLLVYTIMVEYGTLIALAFEHSPLMLASAFVLNIALIFIIPLCLDIFLETKSRESNTGRIRGTNLTLSNTAILIAPFIVSYVVVGSDFSFVYKLSAIVLLPLFFLGLTFPNLRNSFSGKNYTTSTLWRMWRVHKNIRRVTLTRLALECFYSIMVIYTPLYLSRVLGFDWHTIGLIFTIMLLPFVLFERATGWLADRIFGEKEIMTLGLCLMAVSLLLLPNLGACALSWAIVLFISRIGAQAIEVTTESYFFKNVSADDAGLISIFRLTRPTSIVIGALFGGLIVSLYSYETLFLTLAAATFLATLLSTVLRDTR
jgi:MFS family permease